MYVLFGLLPEVCMNVLIQISIPNEKDFHVTHVNGFILLNLIYVYIQESKLKKQYPPAEAGDIIVRETSLEA